MEQQKLKIAGKEIILGGPCDHKGFLVPLDTAPVPLILDGEGGKKVQVMVWKTLNIGCVHCGKIMPVYTGQLQGLVVPPEAPPAAAPPAGPGNK